MATNSYKHILTSANIVTTIRIALVPIFVVVLLAPWPTWFPFAGMQATLEFLKPWLAAAVFALLAFTDSVDGYLARSRNEVTTLGKFLDPLADKILVTAALLALVELNELPAWVVLVIITREFLVSGLRMVVSAEGHVIAASIWGKIKTVAQIIAVILFIIKSNPELAAGMGGRYDILYYGSWAVMVIALLLTLFSMADYFYLASKVLALPLKKGAKPAVQTQSSSLADEVLAEAQARGLKLGTAESCTGGLIAKRLTDIPGASEVFNGSIVSYSNEVKRERLKVSAQTLRSYGAVSEETAREMATGALAALDADFAVSTTGIAGPGGGSNDKPVGTVWIGVACKRADGSSAEAVATLSVFGGSREQIRSQAADEALRLLLRYLKDLSHPQGSRGDA
ncbi:MAG: CDP-diacylglycerol--glycerol-3-phosphate 3-phosphatidyltransferase [Coriobacteriales bacterium]|jgi:CDP-diacylglycerol--glycerol-3-phosphate 3-phosphatidyltransferase|nr:CDP-diacylglycerol--glycerol-3-phosphate 3-phosphatidyltransferase [Coriobacteriales bacterium]